MPPPFPSTANEEEFQPKIRPIFRHPILPFANLFYPFLPPRFLPGNNQGSLIHRNFLRQTWSRLVQPSPAWSNTSEKICL